MRRLHYALAPIVFFLCLTLLAPGARTRDAAGQTSNPAGPPAQEGKRSPDDTLLMTVTVTDKKGNYIGGLEKSAFSLYDDKVQQEISLFEAADEPMSIGVIFDLSTSMTSGERDQLATALKAFFRFVRLAHGGNEYFIIGFGTRPVLLLDWTRADKVAEQVSNRPDKAAPKLAATALYDACYLGIEKVVSGSHRRRALLLVSDGMDNISEYTLKDVRERLRETGVPLYSISILTNLLGIMPPPEGQAVLDELSSISGGVAVHTDSKKKIEALFEQIAIELRHQYLLGFKPAKDKADGKWHSLKIKLAVPPGAPPSMSNPNVRSRSGYYAARSLREQ
jgi:Ca-activated chloride channel family protein